jgi:predicted adenine nucleotide alpha hydrolase (AANH) superfamily ATPase
MHKALLSDDVLITGYFFNPNIHPQEELERRIDALKVYSSIKMFDSVIIEGYDIDLFRKEVVDKAGDRCRNCYSLRIEATARFARQNGYDCFSTTLLISPFQRHDLVKMAGKEASRKYGVGFYYDDLRSFYPDSVKISRQLGLYRQKYCGCYISREMRDEQVSVASK